MDPLMQRLASTWRERAVALRKFGAADGPATAYECAAAELDSAIAQLTDEPLSIREAAMVSGYSSDHISRMIRGGKLANAGRVNAPRVRRGDLPIKPGRRLAGEAAAGYDPRTDARTLLSRRGER